MDNYSYDECAKKSDEILLACVKNNKISFEQEKDVKPAVSKICFTTNEDSKDEYKPYGDLFDDENK